MALGKSLAEETKDDGPVAPSKLDKNV